MKGISLFIPCAVDAVLVDIGKATVNLLTHLGFDLIYHEEQSCCGQPAFSAGHVQEGIKIAKRFIEIFENDEVIISPSGSCVATVKYTYPKILSNEGQWHHRAMALSAKVFELSQFLVDVAGIEDVNARFEGSLAYHKSCHVLRALGVEQPVERLLSKVRNATLVPLEFSEECCGFGGQFSLKYPLISEAMVSDKIKHFIASGAQVLLVSDPGCLLNLMGYVHRHHPGLQVEHLVKFLSDHIEEGG